ncbi:MULTISPECIES: DNA/RNA helicase domain-containing protein [Sphingobacterium]|uniref:DNA/RNA helicase domain-containing protein n=1 Tax=Sphingobacterium populi TaxID=1812824 RepID=A0ABW5UE37_9SPHI|nr:DNA/RNA helicase domain-containing protein [Sphingobacterium sp. CFCC 11742]
MNFNISQYAVDHGLESNIIANHRKYLNWPLVYFLVEINQMEGRKREAYIGETTDVVSRIKTHRKSSKKQKLSSVNLISSDFLNKSAALDLESNLIKYISADGNYSLLNGNLGIANHQYYQQKDLYSDLFKNIWDELRTLGIARHSLEHIDNSDLFKYSPYKSLSKEQIEGLKTILICLLDESTNVSLIQGGAGTGKSILAIFLFKLLKTDLSDFNYVDFDDQDKELFDLLKKVKSKYGQLTMALVIPMASFRKTISNVFSDIKGLSKKMVVGPSEIVKQKYDLLIVDEGHRLRRRVNLGSYFGTFDANCRTLGLDKAIASELDWIQLQSEKSIIFYDQFQSIKPSDVTKESFDTLRQKPTSRVEKLKTQFRVRGGNQYVKFIHQLFESNTNSKVGDFGSYDFKIFENLEEMIEQIHLRENESGLSRMVAGFAWEWISRKVPEAFDIQIGETKLKWNSVTEDWVNSENAINEVGCIHTTQGYDLNYVGLIIGPEIDYDFETNQFVVLKQNYKDKAGKSSIYDDVVLLDYLMNIYKTIMLRGIRGTYVYVCNPNLRAYLSKYIQKFIKEHTSSTWKIQSEPGATTIPFYDLSVAAGSFSDKQLVDHAQYIDLPNKNRISDSFACKVVGESMNKIIPNGSICLFRRYSGGSRNGLICLVECSEINDNDFGANYTIKEYSSKKSIDEDGWKHEMIILKPLSFHAYEPILLHDDEMSDFKVIGVFERVLS